MKLAILTLLVLTTSTQARANNCNTPSTTTDTIIGVAPDGTVVRLSDFGVHIEPPTGKATTLSYTPGIRPSERDDDADEAESDDAVAPPTARWRVRGPKPPLDPEGLTPSAYLTQLGAKLGLTPLVEVPATFDFTWYGADFNDVPVGIVRLVLPDGTVPLFEIEGDSYSAQDPPKLTLYTHPHLPDLVVHVWLNIAAECGDALDTMHRIAPRALAARQLDLRLRPGLNGARHAVARAPASFTARMRLLEAVGELTWREVPALRVPVPKRVRWASAYYDQLRDRFHGDPAFDVWIARRH